MIALDDGERAAFIHANEQDGVRHPVILKIRGHRSDLLGKRAALSRFDRGSDPSNHPRHVTVTLSELSPLLAWESTHPRQVLRFKVNLPPLGVTGQFPP